MNRKDLAELLAQQLDLPKHKTNKAVGMLFDAITAQLLRGREVNISGFGIFASEAISETPVVRRRLAPALQAHTAVRRPTFRPSNGLSRKIAG